MNYESETLKNSPYLESLPETPITDYRHEYLNQAALLPQEETPIRTILEDFHELTIENLHHTNPELYSLAIQCFEIPHIWCEKRFRQNTLLLKTDRYYMARKSKRQRRYKLC